MNARQRPVIVFGAFDRHNFGDLIFPHVVSALLPERQLYYSGLAQRDLRRWGGHELTSITALAHQFAGQSVSLIHAGGELLTCSAWEAAIMLQTPPQAQHAIALYDPDPSARQQWACQQTGLPSLAPYSVPSSLFQPPACIAHTGVGGVALADLDPAMRAEILANLRSTAWVGVRDSLTQSELAQHGIAATLMPDPAVMVKELFAQEIQTHGTGGETARMRARFPNGYVALQFSADFGDDATVTVIAAQLEQLLASSGLGIVLFRAGAAPWHDDLEVYHRVAARMRAPVALLESLHLWDICALIANSRAYCGSSLHGRIVAMAYGLPRLSLLHPDQAAHTSKQGAYAATWEIPGLPHCITPAALARGITQTLAAFPGAASREAAENWVKLYREAFSHIRNVL